MARPTSRSPAPRNPFETFLLAACLLYGFPLIFAGGQPGSITALLSGFGAKAWGGALVVGGGLALAGAIHRSANGVVAQQIGFALIGSAAPIYSVAILIFASGLTAAFPAMMTIAFGAACWWRFLQLQNEINRAVAFSKENPA